jgi:hypothetical protein
VRAPGAEDIIFDFCTRCNLSKCRDATACKDATRGERAWCVRDLLVADHTGAVECGADSSVLHAFYGTENIDELKEATCASYAGLWHGRVMVKARAAGSGLAGREQGRQGGEPARPARCEGGAEAYMVEDEEKDQVLKWQMTLKSVTPALEACPVMRPVAEPCETEFRVFPALALPVEVNGKLQVRLRRGRAGAGDRSLVRRSSRCGRSPR